MKISELSSRSGVPVATVKFYLREGLLAAGEKSSQTQASYDDIHLARLRLIRAFLEVGGLSVASARAGARRDRRREPAVRRRGRDRGGRAAGRLRRRSSRPSSPTAERGRARPHRPRRPTAAGPSTRKPRMGARRPRHRRLRRARPRRPDRPRSTSTPRPPSASPRPTCRRSSTPRAAPRRPRPSSIGTVLGDSLLAGLRRMAHENVSRTPVPRAARDRRSSYGHAPRRTRPRRGDIMTATTFRTDVHHPRARPASGPLGLRPIAWHRPLLVLAAAMVAARRVRHRRRRSSTRARSPG